MVLFIFGALCTLTLCVCVCEIFVVILCHIFIAIMLLNLHLLSIHFSLKKTSYRKTTPGASVDLLQVIWSTSQLVTDLMYGDYTGFMEYSLYPIMTYL